jgi:hypothetical protein
MDLQFLERKDGRGQYLWDPYLWVLAAGAIVFLVALVLLFAELTPPPHGH